MNLFIRIASADGLHVSDVPGVHAYKQVETVVVVPRHLPCRFAFLRPADNMLLLSAAPFGHAY